jgi:hypothetical protein
MKKNILFSMMVLVAGSVMADPKDDVKAAAAALGAADNYSWHQTVEVPADSQFKPGPTDGKTEKGGYTTISFSFGDNTTEAVLQGTNGAINSPDNGWQSLSEAAQAGGRGAFLPRMLQNYKMPAAQAADIADAAKDLTSGTNGISGDLTGDGAEALMSFRGPRRGATPPAITNPKGSVAFTIADGKLVKYSYHVTGSMDFGGNNMDIDRTTTVEIKDVGTTKIEVPDDAKKKLQ